MHEKSGNRQRDSLTPQEKVGESFPLTPCLCSLCFVGVLLLFITFSRTLIYYNYLRLLFRRVRRVARTLLTGDIHGYCS